MAINVIAVVAFMAVSYGYLQVKLRADLEGELRHELQASAGLIQAAISRGDATQQQAVRRAADMAGARVTLIARDGKVIADSHEMADRMPPQADKPEVAQALKNGVGSARRVADTGAGEALHVALTDLDDPAGRIVRVAVDAGIVGTRMEAIRNTILATVAILFLVGLALSFIAARFLVRPIQIVRDAATQIAQGNLDASVNLDRKDELGQLAVAFNLMSRELRSRVGQLESNKRELSAIMDNMSEGLMLVDEEGDVTLANKAAETLLGRNLVGKPLWESVRMPEVDELLGSLKSIKEPRRVWVEDHTNMQARRVLAFVATPLFEAGRDEHLAVLLVSDATEDQKLLEMRQEFVANVSHELKTPLTSISAYVETLLDGASDDASVRRPFLEKIRVNASRLTKLVSDILTVSRLESGTGAESRQQVDLNELAAQSVRRHQESADAKQQTLTLHRCDQPAIALVNEEDMVSAVDNLLDNAISYTPAGGKVDITVSRTPQGLALEVKDTGVGIPPEALPRVFERFYRVDKARSRAMGGTGLGLAIVKHVAIKHGGKVDAESVVGKGSSFRINLPAATSTRLPASPQA